LLGLPVLGVIARTRRSASATTPIVVAEPRAPISEAYRALRTNIDFAGVDKPIGTLLVTSAMPSEGKSTVVVNLSAILAQGQRNVVVVDADLRRPTIHKRLDMTNRSGLSEMFVQMDIRTQGSLRPTAVDALNVVTAGQLPPNPAELLGSRKMLDIVAELGNHADIVVIDSPPVNVVTDAAVLAPRVDAVLLVVRAGTTRLGAAVLAVEQLRRAGANIIGVVVNDVPVGRSGYGYASQGYYKYYGADNEGAGRALLNKLLRRKTKSTSDVTENV
jgi:succinoglycan biosynthesis transport protein ExoP